MACGCNQTKPDLSVRSGVIYGEKGLDLNRYVWERKSKTLHDLNLTFVALNERERLVNSLKIYKKTTLSLEDCYNLVLAKEISVKDFASFDEKLKKYFKSI